MYDKGDVPWKREPDEDEGHTNRDTRDDPEREDSDVPSETAAEVENIDTDHAPGPFPADLDNLGEYIQVCGQRVADKITHGSGGWIVGDIWEEPSTTDVSGISHPPSVV